MGKKQYPPRRKHLKPWERADYKKKKMNPKAFTVHDEVVVTVPELDPEFEEVLKNAAHDWVKLPCQNPVPSVTSVITKADIEAAVKSLEASAMLDADKMFMPVVHPQIVQAHIGQYADYVSFSEMFFDSTDREVEGEEVFQCTMGWEHKWNQVDEHSERTLAEAVKNNEAIKYYYKKFLENLKAQTPFGGPWQ